MKSKVAAVLAVLLFALPAIGRATPVTFNVSGTLGTTFLAGSLPSGSFPFPTLLGGSFDGTFSLDSAAPAAVFVSGSVAEFDYVSVSVNIRNNTGGIIHVIDSGPNRFRVFNNQFAVNLGESFLGDAVLNPEDLRLSFNVAGLAPSSTLPSAATIVGGTFTFGFSETDGASGGSWDLTVASARLTASESTVPEPAALALLALGLAGLGFSRRRKA